MKRLFVVLLLPGFATLWAQSPPPFSGTRATGTEHRVVDSLPDLPELRFGDSSDRPSERMSPYPFTPPLRFEVHPWESETSVVQVRNHLPEHIDVPQNTPRRIATSLWISNGQAWNWGAYPDAFLDARTLSMPLPR